MNVISAILNENIWWFVTYKREKQVLLCFPLKHHFIFNANRESILHRCRTFPLLLTQIGHGPSYGLWVWRRTSRLPCPPAPLTARPSNSRDFPFDQIHSVVAWAQLPFEALPDCALYLWACDAMHCHMRPSIGFSTPAPKLRRACHMLILNVESYQNLNNWI